MLVRLCVFVHLSIHNILKILFSLFDFFLWYSLYQVIAPAQPSATFALFCACFWSRTSNHKRLCRSVGPSRSSCHAQVENAHSRPCPPVCDLFWPCIWPCSKVFCVERISKLDILLPQLRVGECH